MYRKIETVSAAIDISPVMGLYEQYHAKVDLDESDLIIFRLMGVKFRYSGIEFSQPDESIVFDVS
jgi:hypothetical protein